MSAADIKRCVGLTPQLTQRVCIWFGTKLDWPFHQLKAALVLCFGQQTLSDTRIYYWIHEFRAGHVRIVDKERRAKRKSGRSAANIRRVESIVANDRHVTLARIMLETQLKSTTVHRILTKDLGLSKRSVKLVPTHLTDTQMLRRVTVCDFWTRLFLHDRRVFKVAVTVDESWIYCYDPETKEQSREWHRSMEPCPQHARRMLATGKIMVVTFFNAKGLIYREFVRWPRTVNQMVFRQIFTRFDIACQNRRPRGTVQGRRFIHMDNASPHTAHLTRVHMANLGWTVLPHPPYSPDLAPNNFWLYARVKRGLRGRRFTCLQELEDAFDLEMGLIPSEDFKRTMLHSWPARWRKCMAHQGRYFEGIT